jgi:HlyD family secretion protein
MITAAPSQRSIRRHLLLGLCIGVSLVIAIAGWAGTAELSGAVIAPAVVVVESNLKKVQHPTGGIVGELRVHDDQRVQEGEVVLRLDETQTRANLGSSILGCPD